MVPCDPEDCARRLFPGTGSAEFQDLWTEEQALFTFQANDWSWRHLVGDDWQAGDWKACGGRVAIV